ncbi:hemagglutinin repeat-containing protein [Pseudomonas sp. PDM20]|uniref:hemagglutinin repeat-containing protein n=1 Tax=Pseudomonas sp. PDM20 TaxID=2769254 RepID=UPI001782C74F|nr:hemagglutinin repeat-containing protein [Pseudomonas sp. PDM20]MBD9685893.1 hemagglutinin repeat-containing protein [Pseudomonas sp. PDM20]
MDVRHPLYQAIASVLAGILILNPIVAAAAELAVDAAAGGNTHLGAAGNGVPVVNIATPNGAGLSHNKFSDYNVGQNGLILNNATGKTQSTQLGGIIVGNPNLKGGAANKILNEVTGANPSQLRGYTEVAGQAAHVIVANPHGITCNGCGFINTPRATLTTGKPLMDGERLRGYDVDGGEISVEGAGLNASNLDQFELITRSAKLNADLYAQQLAVVTGRNQVDAETLAATAKADDGSAKPQLAIDSSALGGMYAGAIRLVGTEQGVGVKLAGNMAASGGDIQIDANGQLTLARTSAAGNLRAKASDIAVTGPAYASGVAELNASGQLSNSQSLAAGQRVALTAAQVSNSGVVEAGVNPDNSRNAQGDVAITAQTLRNSGSVVASRNLDANASGTLDNQGGAFKGATTRVSAASLDNRQGRLLASDQLTLNAARLDNRNGQAVANRLQVSGGALDNRLGLFSAEQSLDFTLDSLDNSGKGTLVSNGTLQARVQHKLDNQADGLLSAKGALGVQAGNLDNRGGLVVGDAGVTLSGASLNNSALGVISSLGDLKLDVGQLDNSQGGALDSGAALRLTASQVNNAQGSVNAKGDLQAKADSFSQQGGELLAQGALNLDAGLLDNRNGGLIAANNGVSVKGTDLLNQGGEISSRAKVAVQAASLDNGAGKVIGDAGLDLQVQRIANRAGTLAGRDGLSITGQSLDNSQGGRVNSQNSLWLQLAGALDNSGNGALLSQGSLTLNAGSLDNRGGAVSSAGLLFSRLAGALDNRGGKLLSDGSIDLAGADLNNAGGILSAAGDIRLQGAKLDNSQQGRIVTDAAIHLATAQLDNSQGGSLSARGVIDGRIAGLDQHGGGQLIGQGGVDLDLQGGALNNAGGLLGSPGQLALRNVASLDNRGGEISSDRAFVLTTGALLNQGGKILSGDRLTLTSGALNNSNAGVLSGSNGLSVNAASLDNSQGGTLASRSDMLVRSQGALDNHGDGALVASGKLDVGSASLNNQGGLLSATGDLLLATGTTDNRDGRLLAQGRLDASTADLDNRDGVISGAQGLDLGAGNVLNGASAAGKPGGLITSQGALTLRGGKLESTGGGEISAKGDLHLIVAQLIQRQAALIGEGKVTLDLGNGALRGDFDNRGGLLSATGALQINGLRNLDNRGGEISASQGFALTASGQLDNGDSGRIISAGQLELNAGALRNVSQGLLSGWQGLVVNAASLDNSSSGTLSSRDGALTLTVSGALDNHGAGALVSKGNLGLGAGSLNNAGGIVSTQGGLGLTVGGDVDNSNGGLLSAQGSLTGSAKAVDNRAGQISAARVDYDASSLNNSGGSLVSQGALRLGLLGALLNNGAGSKIASGGPLNLSVGSLENRGGQLASQGLLKVLAGRFDNSAGGTVAAQDDLTLQLTAELLNGQDGLVFSKAGQLNLSAASIANGGGTLQGQGDTTLKATGALGNQNGRIISQTGQLDLGSASLENSGGGVINAANGNLKLVTGTFSNNAGTTQAKGLDITATGGIDNRAGHLSAVSGDNRISTTDLNNQGGGLYAGSLLYLRGNQLLNDGAALGQGGKIGAGNLDASLGGALNNQFGLIESSGNLTLGAASINNVVGAIRALGQTPVSLLRAASPSQMKIVSGGLLNNNLGRIEGATQDLILQTGALQNGGGNVLHVGTGTFGVDLAQAGQAGGNFTSNGSLTYQAASWTNNAIIQARNLNLDIGQLDQGQYGQLLAAQSLIGRGGNWANAGLIASDGSLDIQLGGTYSGAGRTTSVGSFNLGADVIDLTGSLAGGQGVTLNANTLNNRGRITAGGNLSASAGTLNNYGTLGGAGDVRLSAWNLRNDGEPNGALIFSGGDMQLRAQNFTNRYANVYSLGSLDFAADDNGGRAASLDNLSATLESQGDMRLNVGALNNERVVLVVNNSGKYTAQIIEVSCYKYFNDGNADCSGGKENQVWEVTERDKLEVLQASAASSISAGGNLNLLGDSINNASSVISAGQNLYANVASLSNEGVVTGETETLRVLRSERTRDHASRSNEAKAFTDQYWVDSPNYVNDPAAMATALSHFIARTEKEYPQYGSTTQLNSGDQSYAGIIQAAGNVSITATSEINNSVIRNNYTFVNPGQKTGDTAIGASPVATVVPINSQLPPDLAQQQVNPITLPGFSLPTGSNGLFRLSGEQGSGGAAGSVQGGGELAFNGQNLGTGQREQALGGAVGGADNVALGGGASTANATSGNGFDIPRVQGLPSSATPSNSHKYLIETNPELTSLKSFLSSDYLLGQLGYDPDKSQKRLGDGLYEQRLIQQAVAARTGQRFIDGMASDEALFRYLMDNAIAYKDSLQLSVGVGLSAEQVAALTHDIVWLEEAEVNGEKVLVPVLYLAQAENRLGPTGALIQGQDVSLISGGELNNAGTLRASNNLSASASNLSNSGLIQAGNRLDLLADDSIRNAAGGIIAGRDVSLTALTGDVINERSVTRIDSAQSANRTWTTSFADSAARIEAANSLDISAGRDVSNLGGVLQSRGDLFIGADRDVNIASVEVTNGQLNGRRYYSENTTQLGAEASAGRDLDISAGRDLNAVASRLDAARDAALSAGRDVTLASAADESHSYSNTRKISSQKDHVEQQGTELTAGGDVSIAAGQDLALKASSVSASGEAYLYASRDVSLVSEQDSDYSYYRKTKTSSSGLSSSTKTRVDSSSSTTQAGSLVSADKIAIRAGQDIAVQGSDVASTNGTSLLAGRNVLIDGATESFETSHAESKKKSGLMSSGGIGVTLGSSSLKTTQDDHTEQTRGSTIGSVLGNVDIQAGKDLTIRGSDLVAGKDINLIGQNVSILEAQNRNRSEETREQKKSGLTLALSGSVGSAVNTAYQSSKEARHEDDSRLAALKGIQAGLTGYQAWQAAEQGGMTTDNAGNFVGIAISLGSQQSKSKTVQEQSIGQGSTLTAGNNLNILATGAGKVGEDGDIRIQGSQLKAGQDVMLAANRDLILEAASNTQKLDGKNSSSGGNVGVSIGFGSGGGGLSVFANGNKGTGFEHGNGTTWTETTVDAGRQVTLVSGRDTSLIGAQVSGEQITAKVGRDLTLRSLQDTDEYKSEQKNVSGGVSVAIIGSGGSASLSVDKSKIHSNYDSVQEQTGLYAGKGGYDIDVGKHTQLDGAVISSTANADKNRLSTDTLGWRDIRNEADFKTQQQGATASSGGNEGGNFLGNAPNGMVTAYTHSDSDSGTTRSAISAGTIDIRNGEAQQQDVASLSRDVEHANGSISPIFDKEKEQRRLQEVQLIAQIGSQSMDIIRTNGEIKATKAGQEELDEKGTPRPGANATAKEIQDYNDALANTKAYQDVMREYGTGSNYQKAAQAVTAALQYLAGGDIGGAVAGASAPYVATLIKQQTGNNDTARIMAQAVLGAIVANAQGNSGVAGAAGAATGELIATTVYPNKKPEDLTESERQIVSALSTLAAGMAGGLATGDSAGVVAAAGAGKTAVENNYLYLGEMKERERRLAAAETEEERKQIRDEYRDLSRERDQEISSLCTSDPTRCAAIKQQLADESQAAWDYNREVRKEKAANALLMWGDIQGNEEARFALGRELIIQGGDSTDAFLNDFSEAIAQSAAGAGGRGGMSAVIGGLAVKQGMTASAAGAAATDASSVFSQQRSFWSKEPVQFNGNKVYQRDDLFDPSLMSSWRDGGKVVSGTNIERMASGRAPIGVDGKSVNLHHTTQTQTGPIAEMTQTFHQQNSSVIHINPNTIPSGIDRAAFDKWKAQYWEQRAAGYGGVQ